MYSKKIIRIIAIALTIVTALFMTSLQAFAAASGTYEPVEGVEVKVSGATDNSMSGGAVTVTAKGSGGLFGMGASSKTATITIQNKSNSTATLSFDWTTDSVNELKIDGTKYTGSSGTFSKVMDPGTSFTATITTAKNNTTNKLVMKNFSVVAAASSSKVTFQHNELGSITVAGKATASGSTVEITKDGAALVAKAVSGAVFLGWVDMSDDSIISREPTFTLKPAADMEVMAAFASASTDAWFEVNGKYLVNNLTVACGKGTIVTLASNGTLRQGNYTIPAGVTLLIPYDNVGTVTTTEPTIVETDRVTPTAFRTLKLATGTNLAVNGTLAVAGTVTTKNHGHVTGPYGHISMASNSVISVASGAKLYAWGYISGSGSVEIKNGGYVAEAFQIADWHGGDCTKQIVDASGTYKLFPFSQFYVQNVEVPMKLHPGATEEAFFAISVTLAGIQKTSVPLVGEGGLFRIVDGYVTKDYNEQTDYMDFTIAGTVHLQPISITLKVSLIGNITIDAKNFHFPIPSHFNILVKESHAITINTSMAFYPGSKFEIEKDATVKIADGKSLFVYDKNEWVTKEEKSYPKGTAIAVGSGYIFSKHRQLAPVLYTTSRGADSPRTAAKLQDASILVNGTLDASGAFVYTSEGGANIYSTGNGKIIASTTASPEKSYQVLQGGSESKELVYCEIPMTIAKLKNGNGVYIQSIKGTYTYCTACDGWHICEHKTNVELGNSLNMHFGFTSSSITDWAGYTVKINGKEVENWSESNGYKVVIYKGLAAKEMVDMVTVAIYDANGNMVDVWTDSIRYYAHRLLAMYDGSNEAYEKNEALCKLLVDMLNYGAACQTYFSHNTNNLANANLSDAQKAYATTGDFQWSNTLHNPDSKYLEGANLITTGSIQLALKLTGLQKGYYLEYTYQNHWTDGDNDRQEFDAATHRLDLGSDGVYYINELVVADARQVITFVLKSAEGTVISTWTDSIESYCNRMGNKTDDVFVAFMRFSDSAEKYLEGGKI